MIGPFYSQEFDFLNHGAPQHQVEYFFAVRTNDTALSDHGWTELEQEAMTAWRWWPTEELVAAGVRYFPENLPDLVRLAAAQV